MSNGKVNKGTDQDNGGSAGFPKHALSVAIKVAQALENSNGGNAMPPTDVAIALGKSPGSSDFRMLLSSSIKYGLTAGSYNQEKVSLTELGRDVVEPVDDDSRQRALLEAAFKPEALRRIFDAYKNKKVPESQFFQNALTRDFGVAKSQAETCANVFLSNADYLGLVREATTGKWLSAAPESRTPEAQPAQKSEQGEELSDVGAEGGVPKPSRSVGLPHTDQTSRNAIFIGHGKNKTPLQQLEKFLTEYKIPYKVAIEEANRGRPISQKVADLMRDCGASIIIFTADEELKRPSGETIYRPSENAVFELGAASALHGSRIVIFKEAGVDFPTNFRDIGHIEFEKDKLEAKVNELFRELISFSLLKVSVAAGA